MYELQKMLKGEISLSHYLKELQNTAELQNQLRDLVPDKAKNNSKHCLWDSISYETFERYQFDLYQVLLNLCRLDGSLGDNLSVYDLISKIYKEVDPTIVLTKTYEDAFDLLLSVSGDRFGGPEVDPLIDKIIQEVMKNYNTKKERKAHAKNLLFDTFHITGNYWPKWIHGPDWPMGVNSPMAFVSSSTRKSRDGKTHVFRDVDTGTIKKIEEFY